MRWLKNLGISPLGWMIIVGLGIYLVSVAPEWLTNGPKPIFENPLDTIAGWLKH